ncbi:MAG: diaminopimelate epimerase [Actinobacteria bacterium]|nr:diaminopimelate epimerase [Actinomycetota bacterium]MCB9388149.1 diaminopimelate epimerase [Acidimicrobiia bacterium]
MTTDRRDPGFAMRLSKYEATANDFLISDGRTDGLDANAASVVAQRVCDRHRGIGADGLIRLLSSTTPEADCVMELHNADGSRAEMSGNGVRTLALAARRVGLGTNLKLRVQTDAGLKSIDFADPVSPEDAVSGSEVFSTVEMGSPTFDADRIPFTGDSPLSIDVDGSTYRGIAVGMGNPHLVVFVDDPAQIDLDSVGARLEIDPRFPRKTNVEFVRVTDHGLQLRVWERGASETLSCGTGACASVSAARSIGLIGDSADVEVSGGTLNVRLDQAAYLTGPARWIADITTRVDL